LLAEDNALNQLVAVHLLCQAGHQVQVADNGREALAMLEAQTFDAVLMDVEMPEMNGLEATAAIRAREIGASRRLPILAVSANSTHEDREEYLAAGMDGFLSKPIQSRELWRFLAGVKPAGEPHSQSPGLPASADAEPACGQAPTPIMKRVARLFQDKGPALLEGVRHAVAVGDAHLLAAAAHKLRGAVAHFPVLEAVDAARQLEQLARQGNLATTSAQLGRLEIAFRRLLVLTASWAAN